VAISPRIQVVGNRLTKHADVSAGKHPRAVGTHQIMKSRDNCALQGAIVPVIMRIIRPNRQELRGKGSRWMKLEKFDRKSSFETFLGQFENCAVTMSGMSVTRWPTCAAWSQTGIAAQLLWNTTELS
jgi:hypothetical protein